MTRLERARQLAKRESGMWLHSAIGEPCTLTDNGACEWFQPPELASLALDGYPAPPTRRKLPACTPTPTPERKR